MPAKPGMVTPARPANSGTVQAKIDHLKAERESAQQSRFQNLSAPTPPKGPSAARNAPRSAASTPAPGTSTPGPQAPERRRPVTPPLPENGPAFQAEDGDKRPHPQDAQGPAPTESRQDPATSSRSKRPPTPELPDSLAPSTAAPDKKEDEDRPKAKEEQPATDAGRSGRGETRAKDERDKEKDRDGKQEPRLKRKRDDEVGRCSSNSPFLLTSSRLVVWMTGEIESESATETERQAAIDQERIAVMIDETAGTIVETNAKASTAPPGGTRGREIVTEAREIGANEAIETDIAEIAVANLNARDATGPIMVVCPGSAMLAAHDGPVPMPRIDRKGKLALRGSVEVQPTTGRRGTVIGLRVLRTPLPEGIIRAKSCSPPIPLVRESSKRLVRPGLQL